METEKLTYSVVYRHRRSQFPLAVTMLPCDLAGGPAAVFLDCDRQPEVLSDAVDFEGALHPSGSCTKGLESKGNNRDALARLDVLASMDNAGSEHNDHFTWNQFEALWITMRRKQDQGCLRLVDVLVLQHD